MFHIGSILGKAATSFFVKLCMAIGTEKFIAWLFFYLGEQIVKSTKTEKDDEFLKQIKDAYYDNEKQSGK